MPRHAPSLVFAVLAACARRSDPPWAATPERALPGEPTIAGDPAPVPRAPSPVTIDGKLDEAAWAGATPLGPFVDPGSGERASSPVEGFARVLWDDAKLYLGFVVRDRSPSSPFGRDSVDPHIWEKSSAVEIMIQPGDPGDNRDYYELQVDVQGAVFDTRWDDYNVPIGSAAGDKTFGHMDWSSKMERAVHVQDGSFYSVEVAIPWTSFRPWRVAIPPKAGDVWRLDLYSFRDGQRQSLAWSPIRGQGNFHRSSRWGRVRLQ